MNKITVYRATDGKGFETELECLDYEESLRALEKWYEYDENNNPIHFKDPFDFEWWKEYDQNNNLIHYKDSCGGEKWYEQ